MTDTIACYYHNSTAVYAGLALPTFVPKLWGKYPDKIQVDERTAMTESARLEAFKRSGKPTAFSNEINFLLDYLFYFDAVTKKKC